MINLRKTTEKLAALISENEKMKRDHQREQSDNQIKLTEAIARRDAFEEELTVYQNQDRAIREKCT